MLFVQGLWTLPWWGYIVVALLLTHITIAAVTLYLHRHQAHHAIDLHPVVSHFFRFWLWLTTAMNTREWVAVHRKHHARVETEEDPHSPQVYGISKVLWEGVVLYKQETVKEETCRKFGHGTPNDWIERHLYLPYRDLGIVLMLFLDVLLFGVIGLTIWAIQMLWIPFFAAGVINGVGHWGGYRNFETPDASTNIVPWGLLIGGEELHNNHHAFTSSARFSNKWWEFDIGWCYIRLMKLLKLSRVRKVAPRLLLDKQKREADLDTVRAVVTNRLHIMSRFARSVVTRVYREEKMRSSVAGKRILRQGKQFITWPEMRMDETARARLEEMLKLYTNMQVVYEFSQRLQAIWNEKTASHEKLLQSLRRWCEEAEATGIEALEEFAQNLRCYTLQTT